jgi:glycosyltransferase involved in cell wall biosynthesis
MKVCMAATTFPRFPGDGQGAFIWELARAVQGQGVAVHVVALHSPGALTQETMAGIQVTRPRYWWPEVAESLRRDGGGLPMTLRKYPLARVQLPVFLARHSAAIAQVARGCDLVHAHWTVSGGAALMGWLAHRKPLLLTVHGSDIFQVPRQPVGAMITRAILRRVDRVTAVSDALKHATVALGLDSAKIEVISNGIDLARFVPPAPDLRHAASSEVHTILFAGFLIKRKGVNYLIEALSQLPADVPPHRLVIVGEGPEEDALRSQVAVLGLVDRVEFVGFQPQAVVGEWMRRARVFVLPSLEEGQGVVLLEALASGTPVIASDVDGMREVVTPAVGLRVPAADPPALARALQQLLTDDEGWRRMSVQARQRAVEVYDWEKIGAHFVDLYARMAARK